MKKNFHQGSEKISLKQMKIFHIKDQLYYINNINIKKKYRGKNKNQRIIKYLDIKIRFCIREIFLYIFY